MIARETLVVSKRKSGSETFGVSMKQTASIDSREWFVIIGRYLPPTSEYIYCFSWSTKGVFRKPSIAYITDQATPMEKAIKVAQSDLNRPDVADAIVRLVEKNYGIARLMHTHMLKLLAPRSLAYRKLGKEIQRIADQKQQAYNQKKK